MADPFKTFTPGLDSPATNLFEAIPNDSTDLPYVGRALNVGQSGFVQLTTPNGDTGRVYVAAGITFPIRAQRIWATGTSATSIAVLY